VHVILRFELVARWLPRTIRMSETRQRWLIATSSGGGCRHVAPQRMMIERSLSVQDVKITIG
jgi:hypothetical protein